MRARQLPISRLHRTVSPAALLVLASIVTVVVAGCGFHLQGSGTLPPALAKTYLRSPSPHSDFLASLTEALRLRGTEVVNAREQAEAVLDVIVDQTGQRVLSVTARNIPREYEVYYAVTFSLLVGQEKLIDSESLVVTRSYTYDETEVLAKASEEQILREALADDLARRVVRRIEALGATAALPPATAPPAQP
jgi:LPS-assembly lipoprotein